MADGGTRVAFVTLGCKVNQAESDAIAESVTGAGAAVVRDGADVVVINTCTVTGEADHKARKAVRHALGLSGSPVVVVTGCLASLDADGLRSLGDRVVVEADKTAVARRVGELLGHTGPSAAPSPRHGRTRVQLKIEDGCDAYCAYCIVPYARGVPRPVPLPEVIASAERLVRTGAQEIVLTGINIGRYADGGADLTDVLEAVSATGVPRVRISSIEPGHVTDRLLQVAAATPAFCAHLHVALQSGSDTVLARMGRPYDTAAYAHALTRIREALPGIAISTDVIVGFPGESDREAAETAAFVEEQAFSRLHVFRYSARAGTPAATMPGQVAPAVRAARGAELRLLGQRLGREYASSRVGATVEVLVERRSTPDAGSAEGTTREYLRCSVAGTDAGPGERILATVTAADADGHISGVPVVGGTAPLTC